MNNLNRIVHLIAFAVCLIGLIATIIFLTIAPDAQWWLFFAVFLVATLWFGNNLLRAFRK